VEFKINLLEPAKASGFLARARVLRQGRTLSVCRADVVTTDPDARMVATMTSTIIIRPLRRS
jgi:acyl-coenzyme A thioesterase PaaI-like protein